jgi:pimeloyl-ACP methyl ester carboxylesterase
VQSLRREVVWRGRTGHDDAASTRRIDRSGVPLPPVAAALMRLSVLHGGDPGGLCVILVHGTPGDAASWADDLLDPPAGTEVLALDRPGFGASDPPAALPRLADQAAAVAALLPADGRPVVLVGHSLGGAVVAQVAAEQRGRIQAVVLVAAALDPALESVHPLQRVGAWPWVQRVLPRPIRNANAELLALRGELVALAPMLARIDARVLIVHGDADDLVPVANVPYIQSRLTGAAEVHTTLVPGGNHFLPWNARPAVRGALQRALEGLC